MKRKRVWLTFGVVVLVIVAVSERQRSRPRFQGRTSDQWFGLFCRKEISFIEASNSFHHLGEPGLEYLSKEAFSSREESELKSLWRQNRPRMPELLQGAEPISANFRVSLAIGLIESQFPQSEIWLRRFLEKAQSADPGVRSTAYRLLPSVAKDKTRLVAILTNGLHDPHPDVHHSAIRALNHLETNAQPAIPLLREVLKKRNDTFLPAFWALASIGRSDATVMDDLEHLLNREDETLKKIQMAAAVYSADTNRVALLSYLERLATSDTNDVGRAAIRQIGFLGAKGARARPVLLKVFKEESDHRLWVTAGYSLVMFGPPHDETLKAFREKLVEIKKVDRTGYLYGSVLWHQMEPENNESRANIWSMLAVPGDTIRDRYVAFSFFTRNFNPSPAELSQIKQIATKDPDPMLRRKAREFLRKQKTRD